MSKKPLFQRIALIGFGLIGSSLARVVRRDGLAGHVCGCARTDKTLAKARELGLADSFTTDPAKAAEGADLVVLAYYDFRESGTDEVDTEKLRQYIKLAS